MNDTTPDHQQLRARLLARLEELSAVRQTAQEAAGTVELDQARQGRLSRMDAMQQQAMARETGRRRQLESARIQAALRRFDDGEYGFCIACGEEIRPGRLQFDPSVTHCVACAEKQG